MPGAERRWTSRRRSQRGPLIASGPNLRELQQPDGFPACFGHGLPPAITHGARRSAPFPLRTPGSTGRGSTTTRSDGAVWRATTRCAHGLERRSVHDLSRVRRYEKRAGGRPGSTGACSAEHSKSRSTRSLVHTLPRSADYVRGSYVGVTCRTVHRALDRRARGTIA